MTPLELGIFGESHARDFLLAKGYKILASNFRFGKLELDLVCEKDNKLIVVEVKTRQTAEIGEPWRAVTRAKQKQIIRASNFYIEQHDVHLETRFDVISNCAQQFPDGTGTYRGCFRTVIYYIHGHPGENAFQKYTSVPYLVQNFHRHLLTDIGVQSTGKVIRGLNTTGNPFLVNFSPLISIYRKWPAL